MSLYREKPPAAPTREVLSEELRVGDTIDVWWHGRRDTITAIEPYNGPLLPVLGEKTRIAYFAYLKMGMTIVQGELHIVHAREGIG